MTNAEVHEALIRWLAALLDITVIKSHQQADRPVPTYGMVELANWGPVDRNEDSVSYADVGTDVFATPEYEVEWVFLFFLYGNQGADLVRKLQSAVRVKQVIEPLHPTLVIHSTGQANSVPELIDEKWEPRVQLNITLRGKASDAFLVDVIEQTTINTTGERS